MKRVRLIKSKWMSWAMGIVAFALGICLVSYTNKAPPVPEAQYPTKIIGSWQGMVGNLKETMSIDANGTFVCQLRSSGFMANTLSQGVAGMVRGIWKINGAIISLRITGAENEALKNKNASSAIVAFREDEIVLKSDHGESSTFRRVTTL